MFEQNSMFGVTFYALDSITFYVKGTAVIISSHFQRPTCHFEAVSEWGEHSALSACSVDSISYANFLLFFYCLFIFLLHTISVESFILMGKCILCQAMETVLI